MKTKTLDDLRGDRETAKGGCRYVVEHGSDRRKNGVSDDTPLG